MCLFTAFNSFRRMANAKGEIRIGASHQVRLKKQTGEISLLQRKPLAQ